MSEMERVTGMLVYILVTSKEMSEEDDGKLGWWREEAKVEEFRVVWVGEKLVIQVNHFRRKRASL